MTGDPSFLAIKFLRSGVVSCKGLRTILSIFVCLLSYVLSDALGTVRRCAGGQLTEAETSDFNKRLADNLLKAFDSGERNRTDLKLAALQGILTPSGLKLYT